MNGIWLYVGAIVGIIGMILITVLNGGDIAMILVSGIICLFIELMVLIICLFIELMMLLVHR